MKTKNHLALRKALKTLIVSEIKKTALKTEATTDGSMPEGFHFGDANEKKYYMEQLRKLELNVTEFEYELLQAIDVYDNYSGRKSTARAVVARYISALDKTLDYLDKVIQKTPVLK